jgi:hypothetical protein
MDEVSCVRSHCESASEPQAESTARGCAAFAVAREVNDEAGAPSNRSPIVEPSQPLAAEKAELNSLLTIRTPPRKKQLRYGKLKLSPKRAADAAPTKRGAPFGNRNAFKHGDHTRERRAFYAAVRAHIRQGRTLIAQAAAEASVNTNNTQCAPLYFAPAASAIVPPPNLETFKCPPSSR